MDSAGKKPDMLKKMISVLHCSQGAITDKES